MIKEREFKSNIFEFSENYLDFGTVSKNQGKISREIEIKNKTEEVTLYFNCFFKSKGFSLEWDYFEIKPK